MNKSRWLFEGWQVRLEEESKAKFAMQLGTEAVKAFQHVLCAVLGTNLEPVAEPDPEKPGEVKYRWPKDGEFTPLIMAIARPDYLKAAMEKVEKILPDFMPDSSDAAPPPLATEEDLEFFDELDVDQKKAFWDATETQQQLKQLVIQMDPDKVSPYSKDQPHPVGLTDADRAEFLRRRTEMEPAKMKFQVDADDDFDLDEPPKEP